MTTIMPTSVESSSDALTAGLVVALALVVGPLAGAEEYVITGTILLAFASSWALLAALSKLWTDAAAAMGAAARRLHGDCRRWLFSRSRPSDIGHRRARLGLAAAASSRFSLRPSFASSGICTVAHAPGSCIRCWPSTRCARLAAAIRPCASRSIGACIRRQASWSTSAVTGFI